MRAESTQPPEGHPFESANDDDNDDEEDGDDDEDNEDNTTDDEDDSDVEYDLEWYWDYQDKTWKRCDPSEWDLEESKETSHQTKPIDEKKGQKEGTQGEARKFFKFLSRKAGEGKTKERERESEGQANACQL